MKCLLQIVCIILVSIVTIVVVGDPPPSPVVARQRCKAECKEQYRSRALECLSQTAVERDDTQREAFNACMEEHVLERSACLRQCLP